MINWTTTYKKSEPRLLIDDQVNIINQEIAFQDTPQIFDDPITDQEIIDEPVTGQESLIDEIESKVIQQNGKKFYRIVLYERQGIWCRLKDMKRLA